MNLHRWQLAFWIAWRNLRAKQKRAGLSFMTMVSVMGVCIGVAALIVVLSVMGGFEQNLRNSMLRGQPHIEVLAKNSVAGFSLKEHSIESFRSVFPEGEDLQPFVKVDVVLKHASHLSSATLFGVQPELGGDLWGFGKALQRGDFDELNRLHYPLLSMDDQERQWPGIILGEGLAVQLGVHIGDEIIVVSPQGAIDAGSLMAGGTLSRTYVVVGTFRSELFNFDSRWAVMNIPEARKFMADYDPSLDELEYVSGVAMNFSDPFWAETMAERLANEPELEVLTWLSVNRALLFALKLEKFTMGSILMLIVIVAAFSISSTMMMNVFHRRTQVALMRSLGMTRADVSRLFILHGMTISIVGIVMGLALGLGACAVLHQFQFVDLPDQIYMLKKLPVKFLPYNYVVICLFALVFGTVASLYPAISASRQEPSEGLQWT